MKRRGILGALGVLTLASALAVAANATVRRHPVTSAADTAVTSASIAFFEAKLAADPWNYPAANRLVDRYLLRFQSGANPADVARAEEVAREVIARTPEKAAAYARLSAVLLSQHQFAEALDAARSALVEDSLHQGALGALFDAALATGDYPLAESVLHRLTPGTVERRLREAHWLTAQGELDGAAFALAQVCRRLERASVRPQLLAWCMVEQAKLELERVDAGAAERLYRWALQVQPGYRGALEGLADLAHARGDRRRARRLYEQIATDAHPDLFLRLAEVQRALGDSARAASYEREFLRVARAAGAEPLYAPALTTYYAGQAMTRDTALAIALREVARRPTVESYDLLSWVHLQRGELEQALQASDLARRWGSPSPTMDLHRALILEALGRSGEAEALLQAARARPELLEPHARLHPKATRLLARD